MKKRLYLMIICLFILALTPVNAQEIKDKQINSCPVIKEVKQDNTYKSIDNLAGNYNNKVQVVFSDIDGTLLKLDLKHPKQEIPQNLKDAVIKLHEAKVPMVLATGRVYSEAKEIAEKIGNENTYIVTNQGAEIWNPKGEIIYKDAIKTADAKNFIDYFNKIKKENNLNSKIILFVDGKLYVTEEVKLPYNWASVIVLKSFKDLGPNYSASLICIDESNPEKIKFIQSKLRNKFPTYNINLSTDRYCDISSSTATKGNAVKKLSEIFGIDLKNAATFGDAENDLSMFKVVNDAGGLTVATGNASDALKKQADYVTLPVWEGGFAKGVDEILLNNKKLDKCNKKLVKIH